MKKNTMSENHSSTLEQLNMCIQLHYGQHGTARDWINTIKAHEHLIDTIDGPYAHNIVGMALGSIGRLLGHKGVKRAIRTFNLADRGWQRLLDEEDHDWKKDAEEDKNTEKIHVLFGRDGKPMLVCK